MNAVKAIVGAIALGTALSAQAQWKPAKPINIIVPWAAGGATDQVTRVAAGELEDALGAKIVVINQPGGAGSIGTMNAMNATKDGYTWTAGAPKQLGTYPVLGLAGTKLSDFHLFVSVTQVPIVSVHAGPRSTASGVPSVATRDDPGAASREIENVLPAVASADVVSV